MRAILFGILMWAAGLCAATAQDLSGLARVEAAQSGIKDGWFGATTLTLSLSQGVPFRVFVLDEPARLVVDFREVDFRGLQADALLGGTERVDNVRFGTFKPGWSRLVADLATPMVPHEIEMPVDTGSGRATLRIDMTEADAEAFAAATARAIDPDWGIQAAAPPQVAEDSFVLVIDPGHGGVDPGAVRDTTTEKDLMLGIGLALRDVLRRAGDIEVVMTRDQDVFVSLPGRVALAHQVGADAFLSLHADALSQGRARGATVYTLSDQASDAASAQLAAQHDRADILAGVDLSGTDDEVATVLMDLARTETMPRTDTFAAALIEAMATAGGPMNKRPRREAGFSVLKSADIPSVLVEVGFLSDERDLANLRDPVWRAVMVEALAAGILQWRDDDLALQPLIRQ
ncbi:N-acetylmuramoyl-L-alanine amidase [uncultured Tateyamaria sp.]|uniref:N-acetylmuramoyl-L-alanine amidase n=1 Tax=uncultured Tateyamaria sp. TaxID=455651 RepID=UPI002604DE77|nr:N-acetylmuramoyl-L-alanine amidase [uncultured Tateyamaria sp.]